MQFSTIISVLSVAAAVSAMPTAGQSGSSGNGGASSAQACGNGQVYSCCNTGSAVLPVLGGACEISILLAQACAPNQAFCCGADQEGLINVGGVCLPITL